MTDGASTHSPGAGQHSFRLAGMSPLIRTLTIGLLVVPLVLIGAGLLWNGALWFAGLAFAAIAAWVWLRFRPARFVVRPGDLEVIWPLKRRELPRRSITAVRAMDATELRRELGWCLRLGAGGLWGAFGALWTQRRGLVQMYISRTDDFVWIERRGERPWLITPERPAEFIRALNG